MGRITIFVSESCGYCLRAKKALEERLIPFVEISISTYPDRRKDMISLSDQLTVPQIFFNSEHIGGATELFKLLKLLDNPIDENSRQRLTICNPEQEMYDASSKNNRSSSGLSSSPSSANGGDNSSSVGSLLSASIDGSAALKYYKKHIATKPDPIDERLRLPPPLPKKKFKIKQAKATPIEKSQSTESELSSSSSESSCAFGCFILPNGNVESLRVVTGQLLNIMPRQELAYYGKFYHDCFSGKEGVTRLMENYDYGLKSRSDAVEFALQLQKLGIIHHVCDDHKFQDTDTLFYRLQPYHEPHALNSFKKSLHCCYNKGSVGLDGLQLVYKLRSIFKGIRERSITSDGMDYIAASHDKEFELFEDLVSELQCIDITTQLSNQDKLKLVFFINLYNLMIQHAFVKVGIPKVSSERSGFFGGVHYNVGGHKLSLDDVEHGIIRANTRHPYQLKLPFANKNDQRRELSVSKLDPRIHFALNCGANSCPPISTYTVDALDEELRIATMSFFEHDSNLLLNEDKMELSLSMILKWYKNDFLSTSDSKTLPEIIVGYLRDGGKRKATLQRMIDNSGGKSIKIKYLSYDWNTDACASLEFKSSSLSTKRTSFWAFIAQSAVYTVTKRPYESPTNQPSSHDLYDHPSLTFNNKRRRNKNDNDTDDEAQRSRNICGGSLTQNHGRIDQRILILLKDWIERKGIWLTIFALVVNTVLLLMQSKHFSNFDGDGFWMIRDFQANASYPVLLLDLVGIFAAFCYMRRGNSLTNNLTTTSTSSSSTSEEYDESKKAQ